MPSSDHIETLLEILQQRRVAGEIDAEAYERLREDVSSLPSGLASEVKAPEADLVPGHILFDRWRLVRQLGQGGFGVVFEAIDLQSQEIRAVKILRRRLLTQRNFLARFRREFELMRTLAHERVVRVHDYQEDLARGLALISMEYVSGCTVWDLVTRARRLNEPVPLLLVLRIAVQTLEALAVAQGQNVLHRDVTPRNILLVGGTAENLVGRPDVDPLVKLVDFGLAGLEQASTFSQTSQVLGTTGYVAPEMFDPAAEVTAAADVYGVGAVAYELVTGQLPVGRFESPSELRKGLALEWEMLLDPLLLDMLRRRPDERPHVSGSLTRFQALEREVAPTQRREVVSLAEELEDVSFSNSDDFKRTNTRSPRIPVLICLLGVVAIAVLWQWRYFFRSTDCSREEKTEKHDIVMVRMCPGTFTMGSEDDDPLADDDEQIAHEVSVDEFWISKFEITNGQYRQFLSDHYPNEDSDLPVAKVSWHVAQTFCQFLGYELPTEAQWEYAARAGTTTPWSFGRGDIDRFAWYAGNSEWTRHPVGTKDANPWGLHDMHGNVLEWVADEYRKYGDDGQTPVALRVLRGGSFLDEDARWLRSARRGRFEPEFRSELVGFRCVRIPRHQL